MSESHLSASESLHWVDEPLPADVLYLDAFLALPPALCAAARERNAAIAARTANAIDLATAAAPHVTLFMGLFPAAAGPAVAQALAAVAAAHSPLALRLARLSTSPEGYVFWDVGPDARVQALHEAVLAALDPLRAGLVRAKFRDLLLRLPPREGELLRAHGFPWVLERYAPHLTLGVVAPEAAAGVAAALGQPTATATAGALGLGVVGAWGTVTGSRGEWELGRRAA